LVRPERCRAAQGHLSLGLFGARRQPETVGPVPGLIGGRFAGCFEAVLPCLEEFARDCGPAAEENNRVRKIAAAAAALPVIAYLFLQAAVRRLLPGSSVDTGQARKAGARESHVAAQASPPLETGVSIRTKSGSLRGSSIGSGRLYGDSAPAPMAVPISSLDADSAAPPRRFQVPAYDAEQDLVESKSQGRIPEIDTAPVFEIERLPRIREAHSPSLGAGALQVMAVGVAVALLVSALLLGLPTTQVAGGTPPSFSPIPPQATSARSSSDLPLDVAYSLKFTKPMNESSVESAITISPLVGLKFQWDATGESLSLAPDPHWQPFTTYLVTVGSTATDQQGLGISTPLSDSFKSGSLTSGQLLATDVLNGLVSPGTAFQLTFSRPVKLITVQSHLSIALLAQCTATDGTVSIPLNGSCPAVDGVSPAPACPDANGLSVPPSNGICPSQIPLDIIGDDPTDSASQVFTATPQSQLDSKSSFVMTFAPGTGSTAATDAVGATLLPIAPLEFTTMAAPEVLRFRPQDGSVTYDTNSPISVRFTTAMDTKSTAAAFTVTANGVRVSGVKNWSEGNTVLTLSPRTSFSVGATIVATVTDSARAVGGLHLGGTATATFTVKQRPPAKIFGGGSATRSSPWHASEVYYMALMNCTRTGGWVTSGGSCSSVTHHTLPAQGRLGLSAGISNSVSRPYAKFMADHRLLSHYLRFGGGSNPHARMCAQGYCGGGWGENIASPGSVGAGGMISIEIFYQNESWCRCEHYGNIMNGHFGVAGVGVWFSNSVRVAIDFYS
jgi:hypothetical protein